MRTEELVDAIVIGSGFGGSVAALRLGQAGLTTLVLERGRRWTVTPEHNTFATYDKPDGRAAWLSDTTVDPIHDALPIDIYTGILDRKVGENISVISGVGVGGGSLTFTGALLQPEYEFFTRIFPRELDYESFSTIYYPRVRDIIQPAPLPKDLYEDDHFESSRLFLNWIHRAGLSAQFFDMAMDWSLIRQELLGNLEAHVTTGQEMWYGLNSGARLSLDKNYLALAEATRAVEILPLHVVTGIEAKKEQGQERYLVSGQRIDTSGSVVVDFTISCKYLFVAAGSIKTSELMVTAKARGTLPRLNQHVGQGWGNNGDLVGIHFHHPSSTKLPQIPGALGTLDENNGLGSVRLLSDTLNDGSTDALLTLSMAFPSTGAFPNSGFFRYESETGGVSLHWPQSHPAIARLSAATSATIARLEEANSTNVMNTMKSIVNASMTAHPLGGMVLGKACHINGQVHGYKHLYIVDGSLLPGSAGCANPALTIAALAEHILEQFLQSR
jgi:cholesterol oxidase